MAPPQRRRILDIGHDGAGQWAEGSPAAIIINAYGVGAPITAAADAAGVSRRSIYNWVEMAERAETDALAELGDPLAELMATDIPEEVRAAWLWWKACTLSRAQRAATILNAWDMHTSTDWKAGERWLARVYGEASEAGTGVEPIGQEMAASLRNSLDRARAHLPAADDVPAEAEVVE